MMSVIPAFKPHHATQQGMKKSTLAHLGTPMPKVSHLAPKEWLGSLCARAQWISQLIEAR